MKKELNVPSNCIGCSLDKTCKAYYMSEACKEQLEAKRRKNNEAK